MITLTTAQQKLIIDVAAETGTTPADLTDLIMFESRFNPAAKNPYSSARGLLQFIDSTARDLGYNDSLDLVTKNPTIDLQLAFPVRVYLNQYKPYPNKQSLYMAVFYPAAQYWPINKEFPEHVQEVNPGIKTPGDYLALVESTAAPVYVQDGGTINNGTFKKKIPAALLIAAAGVAIYFLTREV